MRRLPALGGTVAAALASIAAITYAVDTRNAADQAQEQIDAHGALEGHSDTVPRLAAMEANQRTLMNMVDRLLDIELARERASIAPQFGGR